MFNFGELMEAGSIEAAVAALHENPDAQIISGGTDLLVALRDGKHAGCSLVSIQNLAALKGISRLADGQLNIMAATSFSELEQNSLICSCVPILAQAAGWVGGPQIRQMGTVGGNVCNGVTSADTATALLVLNAQLLLRSHAGERQVPLTEFYLSAGKTVRRQDELLVAIRIAPTDFEGFGGQYIKYAQRNAMDIATLGCSALVRTEGNTLAQLRLAFGVAGPVPMRCPKTEAIAAGLPLCDETLITLSEAAIQELNPRTSWRASRAFRLQIAQELVHRAVKQAAILGGGVWCA